MTVADDVVVHRMYELYCRWVDMITWQSCGISVSMKGSTTSSLHVHDAAGLGLNDVVRYPCDENPERSV